MTPRDTFGLALRHALAHRDRARRTWFRRGHAVTDLEFVRAVMDAADTYRDAAVAQALAAGEKHLRRPGDGR